MDERTRELEGRVLNACAEWRRAEIREAAILLGIIQGMRADPEAPERALHALRIAFDALRSHAKEGE